MVALSAAIVVAWYRLPIWAPHWTIAHGLTVEHLLIAAQRLNARSPPEPDPYGTARRRIADMGPPAWDVLVRRLGDEDMDVRETAASLLPTAGDPSPSAALAAALTHADGDIRGRSASSLIADKPPDWLRRLAPLLVDPYEPVRHLVQYQFMRDESAEAQELVAHWHHASASASASGPIHDELADVLAYFATFSQGRVR